jgi:hypothetical protein
MPRRNQRDEKRRPQHGKKKKRRAGWHKNIDSPGMRDAAKWLREAA